MKLRPKNSNRFHLAFLLLKILLTGPEQRRGFRKSSCNLLRSLWVTIYVRLLKADSAELWKESNIPVSAVQNVHVQEQCKEHCTQFLRSRRYQSQAWTSVSKVSPVFGGRHREFLHGECICGSPDPLSINMSPNTTWSLYLLAGGFSKFDLSCDLTLWRVTVPASSLSTETNYSAAFLLYLVDVEGSNYSDYPDWLVDSNISSLNFFLPCFLSPISL